ncbi:MAG: Ig-like domain-containing protein [Bryobacteraceae bacterium]
MNGLTHKNRSSVPLGQAFSLSILLAISAFGQLNQNCTVSVLNRTVPVNPDGSWVLPNIPANFGQVKAHATCIQNGVTTFGESAFFTVTSNAAVNVPTITLGNTTPIPVSLSIGPATLSLTAAGQTVQLAVTATYPDGSTADVTAASAGTNYTISNSAIATITPGGLVTAVSSGTVVIQADNDGASGIATVPVNIGGASVGGIPISWALAYGLNSNDPLLPFEDPDHDGLTNLQEFQLGTNPINPDTDGDGLTDGDEVNKYHTNPLLADTDGDEIPDGVEITTGTNPLDPTSYDLKKATAVSTLTPPSFTLMTSIANPVISVQLDWKVMLIDGKTTLDLTADPRTHYQSSNLNICNFQVQAGQIFSGSSTGNCTITVSQNTLSLTVPGTVTLFTPVEVSTLAIPGAIAVDVAGNYAYVVAGTNGMTVVDVTNRTHPASQGTLTGVGNAQHVRANTQNIFIADETGFLRIAQAQNPAAPALVASLPITGIPTSLALHGTMLAVAAQSGGVSLVDVSNPASPALIAQLATPSPALGVDFDPVTGLAAIAMGTFGVQIADFSIPASPRLRGYLPGGNVLRVLVRLPAVLLADTQRSVTAINISNPDQPVFSVSLAMNLGGVPTDIAAFGNIAITADDTFGRAVPIISIFNPLQPSFLTYWPLLSPGYSSSIAVDLNYGYLIVPALNLLRIGQYQNIIDTYGIPPTVSITAPAPGTTLIQGQTLTLSANASDDVAVATVNFTVNGQLVYTADAAPYQFNYKVPITATSLTFGATAVDYGNNVGTAANVVVPVVPDPGTTATGNVVDGTGAPVSGATVTTTVGPRSSTTAADGTFSIAQVPTVQGNVQVIATATSSTGASLGGISAAVPPVSSGTTNVGAITLYPVPTITQLSIKSALAGTQARLTVTGTTLAGATTFALQPGGLSPITIQVVSASSDGTSAILSLTIPSTNAIGTFALVANNIAGSTSTAITQLDRFTVVDPKSTVDTDGDGFLDVIEAVFGTDPLDPTSFPVIRAEEYEVESVTFSVLNAPVYNSGVTEVDSVSFSTLNEPVYDSGILEVESVSFSLLNAPVAGVGIPEVDSVVFSVLNQPVYNSGVLEVDSLFSVLNAPTGISGISESDSYFSVLNNIPQQSARPSSPSIETSRTGDAAAPVAVAPIDPLTDSDGDGLPDWLEMLIGTDPQNPDTDGDGLNDFEELFVYRTNPLDADTDGDGFSDGIEVLFGSDPLDPNSTPLNSGSRNRLKPVNQLKGNESGKLQRPNQGKGSRVGLVVRHAAALFSLRSAVRNAIQ